MKIEINKKDIKFILIMMIVITVISSIGITIVGSIPEKYHDLILETIAAKNSNINDELLLFWIIIFGGIVFLLLKKIISKEKIIRVNLEKENNIVLIVLGIINIFNLISFILTGKINLYAIFFLIIYISNYIFFKGKEISGCVLFIFLLFSLSGVIQLLQTFSINLNIDIFILVKCSLIINYLVLIIDKKYNVIKKILLVLQAFIPFILLTFICEKYFINGESIIIDVPINAKILIWTTVILMFIYSIYKIKKNFNNAEELKIKDIVLITTCMIIFVINSVDSNVSAIVPIDFHHPAENIISFQQIFVKGLSAYKDYFPVSGLFPVLEGGLLEVFGGGITNYYLAHACFISIFAMITLYILSKHIDKFKCLIVSIFFYFPTYNRIVFILLSILILLLPKLIKNKNLWLKIWIWLCFIGGLYYPTFGAAVLIGTLPFAIMQFVRMIKDKEFKINLKSVKFSLEWVICLIPIVLCIPLLYNLAKHVLLYASQTNLADGISIYGQQPSVYFLPFLNNKFGKVLRNTLYYGIRFMLPISVVLILFYLFLKSIDKKKIVKSIMTSHSYILIIAFLVLLFSYKSTMVRNDVGTLVSRSSYVMILIFGILLYLFLVKYLKKNDYRFIFIGIIIGLTFLYEPQHEFFKNEVLKYQYEINEDVKLIDENMKEKYPRIGNGLIYSDTEEIYSKYSDIVNYYSKFDKDIKYCGLYNLSIYYVLDLTTVGQPSVEAIKDYYTHNELIEKIKQEKPIVGIDYDYAINYYLYNYLLTSNEYIFDENYEVFLPTELYKKIYGNNNVIKNSIIYPYKTNLYNYSTALGNSLKALEPILEKVDVKLSFVEDFEEDNMFCSLYNLDKEINGNDADLLYIEFDNNEKNSLKEKYSDVFVYFDDYTKESQYCLESLFGNGKLLVLMGCNSNWLLNNHQQIKICSNISDDIKIKNISFYKLNKTR